MKVSAKPYDKPPWRSNMFQYDRNKFSELAETALAMAKRLGAVIALLTWLKVPV